MANDVVLGIDLGTSAVKILALCKDGRLYTHSEPLQLIHPQNGYNEQDPEDWVLQTYKAIRIIVQENSISPEAIRAVSFSGQMHGLVALGAEHQALRNAILWNDTRAAEEVNEIHSDLGEAYIKVTGNRAVEGYVLPKFLWLQRHEPDVWNQIRAIILPKDFLRLRMTGKLGTDYSDATGTGYFDIQKGTWSQEILTHFGIPLEWMPPVISSGTIVGALGVEAAMATGLSTDTMVTMGGADNAMGAIGAGVLHPDQMMSSIGTSGVILHPKDHLPQNYGGQLQLERHAIQSRYYSMGVTLAAGNSLSWFRDTFAKDKTFEDLIDVARRSTIGANGVRFAPYLSGERTPYFDPHIRGAFTDISNANTFDDFARAVLEGIVFSLNDVINLYSKFGILPKEVIAIGGGAKNAFWAQMQADIFKVPIKIPKVDEGPGFGAAMIASVAAGWFRNVEEAIKTLVFYPYVYVPVENQSSRYEIVYESYHQLYARLK